jgi:hypothetical protein
MAPRIPAARAKQGNGRRRAPIPEASRHRDMSPKSVSSLKKTS